MSMKDCIDVEMNSVETYFKKTSPTHRSKFHPFLTPVPYLGDLDHADIFLPMTNPSAGYADYCTNANSKFQDELEITRSQEFKNGKGLCLALDPNYCDTSWFQYYERLLKKTILRRADGKSYMDALRDFASRFAIVELVPYYSAEAGRISSGLVMELESAKKAKAAAQDLVENAKRKEILVMSDGINRICGV
jgi:hypothetical protein